MDKTKLIQILKEQIKKDLLAAVTAAQNTYDIATHEENKAENKYDTRGLEASYLAGAQAQRAQDIKMALASFENVEIRNFSNSNRVALTALVQVEQQEKIIFLLLMPKGGGMTVIFEGVSVQVITPESPLGKNLIGKEVGEMVRISSGEKHRDYEILNLQ